MTPTQPASGKPAVIDALMRQGFVPIFVNDTLDSRRLVAAAAEAGCAAIEYTCRRPDAREMIPWIKREFPHLIVLGATLMDGPKVEAFLGRNRPAFLTVQQMVDLGADVLVSFLRFRPETYARYAKNHVMVPGVFTPNEALDQLELGADFVKTTVHTTGGLEFVTKTGVPTHGCLPFFISGGVNRGNLESFIQANVAVTAAGFDVLLDRDTSLAGAELQSRAVTAIRQMLETVQAAREKHQRPLADAIRRQSRNLLAAGPWYRAE